MAGSTGKAGASDQVDTATAPTDGGTSAPAADARLAAAVQSVAAAQQKAQDAVTAAIAAMASDQQSE